MGEAICIIHFRTEFLSIWVSMKLKKQLTSSENIMVGQAQDNSYKHSGSKDQEHILSFFHLLLKSSPTSTHCLNPRHSHIFRYLLILHPQSKLNQLFLFPTPFQITYTFYSHILILSVLEHHVNKVIECILWL